MTDHPLFDDSRLPPDLDARVRSELDGGERLLWVGQPRPGLFARQAVPVVLFGVPWTAFSVFWVAMASGMMFGFGRAADHPGVGGFGVLFACFPLFGVPFVLVGLVMLTSPYWAVRKARRTAYALTDRRAVVWEAGFFNSVEVRSYRGGELGKLRRVERPDGSGDLIFEEGVTVSRDSDGDVTRSVTRRGFVGIDNVRRVEELLRRSLLADA